MEYYAGIDLGGSKIFSLVIDGNGNVLGRAKVKTGGNDKFENILKRIMQCYEAALEKSHIGHNDIKAIGLAVPGAVDTVHGTLIYAPNLSISDIPLSQVLHEKTKKPVYIDNDANMGIFAEYHKGAAAKFDSVYGLFVGTGIGGGYVRNGEIIRGYNYTAGEVGHMIVKIDGPKCGCGRNGCLEAIAGKLGIVNYIDKQVTKKKQKTMLTAIKPDWKKGIGSKALKKCYENNDPVVCEAIKKATKALGIGVANLINTIGIEAIVIGGGLYEELGKYLLPEVEKYMHKYSISNGSINVKLLLSELGDDAVAFGAAWFVRLPEKQHLIHYNQ